jgi:hypothetical protein
VRRADLKRALKFAAAAKSAVREVAKVAAANRCPSCVSGLRSPGKRTCARCEMQTRLNMIHRPEKRAS